MNIPYIKAFKLLKFGDWNVENRQDVILNDADYLCKGINAKILSGSFSEVVLSVTIKDANALAICACVAGVVVEKG